MDGLISVDSKKRFCRSHKVTQIKMNLVQSDHSTFMVFLKTLRSHL